ncbi:CaiB/BaiF CoA transferase family protein [Falsiroseomonas sp. CW058]|uniref:CaiB/BaiF CoA transferase family protein n=1 Tax=Falsiroseomonas sp. CW058 TaxID=3388664 RepID=UPI003D321851
MPPGALDGVRVLDLSSVILGPMTAQYLGDMGADVIKVEPPEGDITRAIGPRRHEGMGALFMANNRNKRSIVLDLKEAGAQAALRGLAARSDVLLHSIRTPAAERLGLGWEALSAANPRLVLCHVTGFAEGGPYAGRPAYDDIIQSLSGLAMLQAAAGGEPRYVPSIIGDKITAVHAAMAIALALFHRERSGQGQLVRVPMLETLVAFTAAEHLGGHVFDPPAGGMGYAPVRQGLRRPHRTKDGWLCLLPYTDAHWRRFLDIAGRPDLAADPDFATLAGRQKDPQALWRSVAALLPARTSAEWLEVLLAADIPAAAVNDLEDLLDDPQLAATGFWEMHAHPTEGMLRLPASPLHLAATPPAIRRLPPRLGEHTAEVLREFGLAG